jgi:hypothetical protein
VYLRVRPAEFVVFGRPEELGAGLDLRAYGGQLVVSREQGPAGGQLSALHVSSSAKLRQDIKVFLFFREKKNRQQKTSRQRSESMTGWRCGRNNDTSVFISSVASGKVSKFLKIGSLGAENEHFIARAPNRGVSKANFLYKKYMYIHYEIYEWNPAFI